MATCAGARSSNCHPVTSAIATRQRSPGGQRWACADPARRCIGGFRLGHGLLNLVANPACERGRPHAARDRYSATMRSASAREIPQLCATAAESKPRSAISTASRYCPDDLGPRRISSSSLRKHRRVRAKRSIRPHCLQPCACEPLLFRLAARRPHERHELDDIQAYGGERDDEHLHPSQRKRAQVDSARGARKPGRPYTLTNFRACQPSRISSWPAASSTDRMEEHASPRARDVRRS